MFDEQLVEELRKLGEVIQEAKREYNEENDTLSIYQDNCFMNNLVRNNGRGIIEVS